MVEPNRCSCPSDSPERRKLESKARPRDFFLGSRIILHLARSRASLKRRGRRNFSSRIKNPSGCGASVEKVSRFHSPFFSRGTRAPICKSNIHPRRIRLRIIWFSRPPRVTGRPATGRLSFIIEETSQFRRGNFACGSRRCDGDGKVEEIGISCGSICTVPLQLSASYYRRTEGEME